MEEQIKKIGPRRELLNELGLEDSIVFENPDYDSAIIGYDMNDSRIVYDYELMIQELVEKDGMTYDEAADFVSYNTLRAIPYAGEMAPIVLNRMDDYFDFINSKNKTKNFDVKEFTENCIQWIKDWFEKNGKDCKAIIGMSGGKDSTVAAALCAKALGPENVIGIAMPDGKQSINDADKICKYLGIEYFCFNIGAITRPINSIEFWSNQSKQNIPPRVRMTLLYAMSQTYKGRVVGTCNKSELYVGYATRYGDMASDFEPLGDITCNQVVQVGHYLGLPSEWVDKKPDDGLPNSEPDDDKFAKWGFSYESLDKFLETGSSGNLIIDNAIIAKHNETKFKLNLGEIFKI
jgi:NAD+ synthase